MVEWSKYFLLEDVSGILPLRKVKLERSMGRPMFVKFFIGCVYFLTNIIIL